MPVLCSFGALFKPNLRALAVGRILLNTMPESSDNPADEPPKTIQLTHTMSGFHGCSGGMIVACFADPSGKVIGIESLFEGISDDIN